MADEIDLKTQETAKRLFGGGIKMDPPLCSYGAKNDVNYPGTPG